MGLQSIGLCLLFCVFVIEMAGSSSQRRFIQTEENLLMTVTEEVTLGNYAFYWKFNKSKNIVQFIGDKHTALDNYKGRVVFFQNLSLILKNVRLSDSGIYTAVVLRGDDDIVASYDVKVQAPVSPVTVNFTSVLNASELCNFTVSCGPKLSSISINKSFTCDRLNCESVTSESSNQNPDSISSLQLKLNNVSIICEDSNHVSRTEDTKNYRDICENAGKEGSTDLDYWIYVIVVVVVILLLLVLIFFAWRKRQNKRITIENTVYDVPECLLRQPGPGTGKTESPNTIYSEVQPHSGPAPTPVRAQIPESLYATVNKPQAPAAPLSVV